MPGRHRGRRIGGGWWPLEAVARGVALTAVVAALLANRHDGDGKTALRSSDAAATSNPSAEAIGAVPSSSPPPAPPPPRSASPPPLSTAPTPPAPPSSAPAPRLASVTVTVNGDKSYVLVERSGQVLVSQVLHHGQSVAFSGPWLHVRLGNAAAVLLQVNNSPPRVPGGRGQVIDFVLRPG